MATAPSIPKGIVFKVTSGREGQVVKATNITRGGTIRGQLNSKGECRLNPTKELGTSWAENDKIQGSIQGEIIECAEKTIGNGGAIFKFDNSAATIASISI